MSKEKFSFNLLKEDGFSRVGKINTQRGEIDTPTFMTVGTQGTIKSAFMEDIILAGAQIILSNTYHLMIRPGIERINRTGGLHEFMNCKHGKKKHERWSSYVDMESDSGKRIYGYAKKNPKKSIIVQHDKTGHMIYLKKYDMGGES